MSPAVQEALERYEDGAAMGSALRFSLWSGEAKTPLSDEIAQFLQIGRPLTDAERGFFDRLEEWLSA